MVLFTTVIIHSLGKLETLFTRCLFVCLFKLPRTAWISWKDESDRSVSKKLKIRNAESIFVSPRFQRRGNTTLLIEMGNEVFEFSLPRTFAAISQAPGPGRVEGFPPRLKADGTEPGAGVSRRSIRFCPGFQILYQLRVIINGFDYYPRHVSNPPPPCPQPVNALEMQI